MNTTLAPEKKTRKRKPKQTENIKRHLGNSITIKWGVSRGRDTGGYTTCSLRNQKGRRVAYCNGGGYDMEGTVVGNWLVSTFPDELRALELGQMPKNSHWESERKRVCDSVCKAQSQDKMMELIAGNATKRELEACLLPRLPEDCSECPECGGNTRFSGDGKTVDDGRYFYGLRFSDPNYDAWNARLERCDNTFTNKDDVGKTFRELKAEGKIVDLDLIRTWYKDTSKHATLRHTQPCIDGACGISSVMRIANAIGISLEKVHDSKKLDVYIVREYTERD